MARRSPLPQVLLLATLALLSCTATEQTTDDPAASEAPTPTPRAVPSIAPPPIPSAPELSGQVTQLSLAGPDHAAALLIGCSPADGTDDCPYHVAVLESDQWQVRETPLPPTPRGGSLYTVEAVGTEALRISSGEQDWVSSDGGRHWTPAEPTATESVPEIPPGAVPRPAGQNADDRAIEVLLPETAEARRLAEQPPLTELGRPGPLPDGGWWVAGLDPETEQPDIAVTRDAGRGWQRLGLLDAIPTPHPHEVNSLVLAAGPTDWYVLASGNGAVGTGGAALTTSLLTVYRSSDEGASWRPTWSPGSGPGPQSLVGTPIAGADGSLTVYSFDAIYTSTDRALSFAVTRQGAPPELPELTPAGHLLTDLGQPGHYRLSADGFSWRTVILGGRDRAGAG
ncbi:hypothetical protein [Streptomyces profundus]|uniref:hypothetical protein n=1 Tax=Streptomyces profundus TaxID=2867410 RepID=UPI001D16937C|nr:hypothetical protein [Streptomyces sp. MA3_2.13]UED84362.1 hypothetical protein K4G22_09205 [Streptomyces sp. MA3_2.13]